MTLNECVLETLEHEGPDRVPHALTITLVTGPHYITYEKLRDYLGLPKKETEMFDRVQGLIRIDEDTLQKLMVDTRVVLTGNLFGWEVKLAETAEYEQFTDVCGLHVEGRNLK